MCCNLCGVGTTDADAFGSHYLCLENAINKVLDDGYIVEILKGERTGAGRLAASGDIEKDYIYEAFGLGCKMRVETSCQCLPLSRDLTIFEANTRSRDEDELVEEVTGQVQKSLRHSHCLDHRMEAPANIDQTGKK